MCLHVGVKFKLSCAVCVYIHALIYLQIFSVVIATYISEISFGNVYTKTNLGVYMICYANPNAVDSSYRICNSLVGAAISSIMVCMMLMIFDVFIPCVDKMVNITI